MVILPSLLAFTLSRGLGLREEGEQDRSDFPLNLGFLPGGEKSAGLWNQEK